MEAIVITKENFEEQVLRAEKPVLVDFWAPWCTYCRRIAPAVDQVAGQYGEQMVVGKVNVDEQPELAERFGVETIPTLLVFRNGQAGEPLIAPGSKAQIVIRTKNSLSWMVRLMFISTDFPRYDL